MRGREKILNFKLSCKYIKVILWQDNLEFRRAECENFRPFRESPDLF